MRVREKGSPEKKSVKEETGLAPERIDPAAVVVMKVNR
jgi:hypothetical protein